VKYLQNQGANASLTSGRFCDDTRWHGVPAPLCKPRKKYLLCIVLMI